jgi:hypothetical protein
MAWPLFAGVRASPATPRTPFIRTARAARRMTRSTMASGAGPAANVFGSTAGSTFGPTTSSSLTASNQSTSHHHRVTFQIWRPISPATARLLRRSRMTASHSRSGPCSTIGVSIRVRIRGRGLAESEAPRPSSRTCVTGARVTMTTIRGSRVSGHLSRRPSRYRAAPADTHRRDFEVAHNPARCAVGSAVCLAWSRRAFGRGGAAGNGRHAALA